MIVSIHKRASHMHPRRNGESPLLHPSAPRRRAIGSNVGLRSIAVNTKNTPILTYLAPREDGKSVLGGYSGILSLGVVLSALPAFLHQVLGDPVLQMRGH